jgi:hypothetical protein
MTLPFARELQGWEAIGTKRQSRHSVSGERMAAMDGERTAPCFPSVTCNCKL